MYAFSPATKTPHVPRTEASPYFRRGVAPGGFPFSATGWLRFFAPIHGQIHPSKHLFVGSTIQNCFSGTWLADGSIFGGLVM